LKQVKPRIISSRVTDVASLGHKENVV